MKISVGVIAPGRMGTPKSTPARMTSGNTTGVTMKLAPASRASFRPSIDVTVPAPTLPRSPKRSRVRRIRSAAPGLFKVTSRLINPPAITAGTNCSTWARGKKRRMPTMGIERNSVSLKGVLIETAEDSFFGSRSRVTGHGSRTLGQPAPDPTLPQFSQAVDLDGIPARAQATFGGRSRVGLPQRLSCGQNDG